MGEGFDMKMISVQLALGWISLLSMIGVATIPVDAQKNYVWVEGETPSAANFKVSVSGWGHSEFLSGAKWLQVSVEADKVEKEVPTEGVLLSYNLVTGKSGKYEVWNRIGYEFVRSAFDWRIDAGAWKSVSPNELTTDLMELQDWNEVAWLKLGEQTLSAGAHKLIVRLPKSKDVKGKFERILYASDAICLSSVPFHPNSHFKPDDSFRDSRDSAASNKIYEFPPESVKVSNSEISLEGDWEVCRNDERLPGEVATPIKDFPASPHWKAIHVPGDKMQNPELVLAHRLWYRCRVKVPAGLTGRSFQIAFPQNNLNTTVFVNGTYCGFNKNPFAPFEIDLTKGIKPGQVNEIWVGIKDSYYGYSTNPKDPMKLRRVFNLPLSFTHNGFQDLAYPIWNAFQSGILVTPTLKSSGVVYLSDVFVKPSVAKKELSFDYTLTNTTSKAISGELSWSTSLSEKISKPIAGDSGKTLTLNPGETKRFSITKPWSDPKLWTPETPFLYSLKLDFKVGKETDRLEVPFGFREWTIDGTQFKLNGIPFHGYHEAHGDGTPDEWYDFHKKTHQRMTRFWGTDWKGMAPEIALNWFDQKGVVVRRSGMLDGEAIGYNAIENDPVLRDLYKSNIKMDLMQNWRDQVSAQVRGERNHPSIMLWSIENEWLYINCINLYGDRMDQFEAEVKKTADAVLKLDPTRTLMTDGGSANKDNSMPVHGNHYISDSNYTKYPGLAYTPQETGGGRGRWVWDKKRPRFIGEDYFISGVHPELSAIGGEAVFSGKQAQLPAAGLMAKILHEGYRWNEFGAWDLYMQPADGDGSQYNSLSPIAVLCREWDWTFLAGTKVKRHFAIFNDTQEEQDVEFGIGLDPGQVQAEVSVGFQGIHKRVRPGTNEKFEFEVDTPSVLDASPKLGRQEFSLKYELKVKDKVVFKDIKAVTILHKKSFNFPALKEHELQVYDPNGSLIRFLESRGKSVIALRNLDVLNTDCKVLIVGKDALTPQESASSRLAAFAASGKTVIVLEQKNSLKYQALPAQMETGENEGRAAFLEDPNHPAFIGLRAKDFFVWGADEIVYRNAYQKPTRGAKSLLQCDNLLQNSALVEVPTGKGVMLLSQLALEEKLESNAVAQTLLSNLIDYGATYKQVYKPVSVVADANSPFGKATEAIGVNFSKASSVLEALKPGLIAIVQATPENLKTLAGNQSRIDEFAKSGGWLVLNGLTPEGLADYNKIVGFDHMIRPFKRERVTFPAVRNPLTAGMATGDISIYSGQRIFNFQDGNYVASDAFSYIVDYDEIAPFGKSSFFAYENITNNFVSADGWPLIINFPFSPDGKPFDVPIAFPKPQTITEFTWVGNVLYDPQTQVNLLFDGKDKLEFKVNPNAEPQILPLKEPKTVTNLTLQIADWVKKPGITNIGIDNIYLKAQRPKDFYQKVKPLLNIGGMMEYPRGSGGVLLCNLNFKDAEEVPENITKKRNLYATLLRNLKASFSGGASVIAGANLNYTPIDIGKQANQYRDERGWFGDKTFTFKDLPTGKHTFAGVTYQIFDFPTSPVPTCIMLGGNGIPNNPAQEIKGIPIHRKADALFFLHAARIDARRNEQEVREKKRFEMARYVVHYADGQSVNVPIYSEIDVDDYRQTSPKALPGAQIAWTKLFAGTDQNAVAYAKQWDNPRPDVAIASVDFVYGADRRGVPVLLAITGANPK